MAKCGGLTQAKPAISEVQEICDLVTKFTLRSICYARFCRLGRVATVT